MVWCTIWPPIAPASPFIEGLVKKAPIEMATRRDRKRGRGGNIEGNRIEGNSDVDPRPRFSGLLMRVTWKLLNIGIGLLNTMFCVESTSLPQFLPKWQPKNIKKPGLQDLRRQPSTLEHTCLLHQFLRRQRSSIFMASQSTSGATPTSILCWLSKASRCLPLTSGASD